MSLKVLDFHLLLETYLLIQLPIYSNREPLVAADLLNHNEFVRKVACVSHSQRTLERYYIFNTSYDGIVTNSVPGDHCTRYQASVYDILLRSCLSGIIYLLRGLSSVITRCPQLDSVESLRTPQPPMSLIVRFWNVV